MSIRPSLENSLDKLAQIAVRIGLNLAPGQELVMNAPIEALPLTRRITNAAYAAGASLVTTFYEDDEAILSRFRFGNDASFDCAAGWLYEAMGGIAYAGAARLEIIGTNPRLLKAQNPEKVARYTASLKRAFMTKPIGEFDINWTALPYPTPSWAKAVFPGDAEEVAVAKLWDAIFAACRVDVEDPISAWKAHNASLSLRRDYLNAKQFAAIRFKGPGTDLHVGFADSYQWCSGASKARNGIICNSNLPTEEVFTVPHKDRVNGTVRASKPLAIEGSLIEDICVSFEDGRIVAASASAGEDLLLSLLNTDDGARRLGEIALVPYSSPISKSGLLFFNTLLDENAASHIAIGHALLRCFTNRDTLDEERFSTQGGNRSLIHIDWMIGSPEMDVDGITGDGKVEPLMRAGEWAF